MADWGSGMFASCNLQNLGSSCLLTRAVDGRIVRCGVIRTCQSAATSEIVNRLWSQVCLIMQLRSAMASTGLFFTLSGESLSVASTTDY